MGWKDSTVVGHLPLHVTNLGLNPIWFLLNTSGVIPEWGCPKSTPQINKYGA